MSGKGWMVRSDGEDVWFGPYPTRRDALINAGIATKVTREKNGVGSYTYRSEDGTVVYIEKT
jgi:hypothetical protein